jgi:hypothetical protein
MCSQSLVRGPPVVCELYAAGSWNRHIHRSEKENHIGFHSNFIVRRVGKQVSKSAS